MTTCALAVRPKSAVPIWLAAILLGLLATVRTSFGDVKDAGKFFGQQAVQSANDAISDLQSRYHKDVVVETFSGIPADRTADYSPQDKDAFFAKWARDRFANLHVNGIYVLICKDPPFLKTEIGQKTIERDFTAANGRELSSKMLAAFKAKQFDDGLQTGIAYIRDTLAQNTSRQSSANTAMPNYPPANSTPTYAPPVYPSSSSGGFGGIGIFGIFLLLFVVMIVIAVVRRVFSGPGYSGMNSGGGNWGNNQGYPPVNYGNGGGSGGFGRGFLGGLLGGAAGGYLYDQMSHRDQQNTSNSGNYDPPASSFPSSHNDNGIASNQDTGGGSFDNSGFGGGGNDSSGGGDFGGGGGGGGDNSGGGSF